MTAFVITARQLAILALMFLTGYIIKKKGYISEEAVNGLSFVLLNISAPAMIFMALQIEYSPERLKNGLVMTLCYILVMVGGFLAVSQLTRRVTVKGDEKKVWLASAMMFNGLYIGAPLTEALYGETALFYVCFGTIGWNIVAYTLGISVFIDGGKKRGVSETIDKIVKIVKNPVIISCFLGLVVFFAQIKLPDFLLSTGNSLAQTTIPLSMIVSGAFASKSPVRKLFTGKNVYILAAMRLVVLPIAALIIFSPLLSDNIAVRTVALAAAMPVGTLVPVLAEQFGRCGETGAKYFVVTTLLSLLTIPLVSTVIFNFSL